MALAHNLTSLVCSILAWIFFVIGCIGNSTGSDNVQNAPWIIVNPDAGGNHIFFGTQAFYQKNTNLYAEDLTKYKNCENGPEFCTPCLDNGRITFALLVIAVIFAALAIIFSAVLLGAEVPSVQYTNLALTGASTVMAVVGWSVFMRRCYHHIDESLNTLEYGAGASLTLLGFLLMGIAVIVNVLNIVCPVAPAAATAGSSKSAPVPQADEEDAKIVATEEAKPVE